MTLRLSRSFHFAATHKGVTIVVMTLLESLRHETRDAHEALHHHALLAPMKSLDLAVADYRYALLAFDAFYAGMEPQVPAGTSAPVRDWLAHDLARQGLTPVETGIALPRIVTRSQLWGYLYVKQGSTLGGGVMSKTLNRALGLKPMIDQRFFAGYGDKNGAEWKKFIENLFDEGPSLFENETIDMAVACFQGVADICDAVLRMKAANALQAP